MRNKLGIYRPQDILNLLLICIGLLLFVLATSCQSSHSFKMKGGAKIDIDPISGEIKNIIHIDNPIIEFCERMYPVALYPNEVIRETNITECMRLCRDGGQCTFNPANISDIENQLNGSGL